MPRTIIGKWSVGLLFLFGLFVLVAFLMRRAGHGFDQAGVPYIGAMALGVATFMTALVGLFKQKDRAFLVVFSAAIGFIVTLAVIFVIIGGITYQQGH